MKNVEDAWNCVKWVIWICVFIILGIGVAIGIALSISIAINRYTNSTDVEDNTTKPINGLFLESKSPYYSIPKNTQIVAVCNGGIGVYAFIVKSVTNDQHYVVNLYNKQVESIPFVDVITKTEAITKEEVKHL